MTIDGQRTTHRAASTPGSGKAAVVELTPLIDIVFQLLIFFVLTATFHHRASTRVDLPRAAPQQAVSGSAGLSVSIAADGSLEVDGEPASAAIMRTTCATLRVPAFGAA